MGGWAVRGVSGQNPGTSALRAAGEGKVPPKQPRNGVAERCLLPGMCSV